MAPVSLAEVRGRMAEACARAGRDPDEVQLVAVSKGRSLEEIAALMDEGQIDFGENRAQDLRDKVAEGPAGVRWHFVGPLQTNKVRMVRPAVSVLHSMDRPDLATAWLKGPGAPPPVHLQVNIGDEDQKSGVVAADAGAFCDQLASLGIRVIGVMAIPPLGDDPRPHFSRLRSIRDRLAADHTSVTGLSMGMTDDFEVAIEEGATVIRVGRAIFSG